MRPADSANVIVPFSPAKLQNSGSRNKQIYLRASDFLINSFLHHAHNQHFLKYSLDEKVGLLRMNFSGNPVTVSFFELFYNSKNRFKGYQKR